MNRNRYQPLEEELDLPVEGTPDPYVGSKLVYGLSSCNFQEFLDNKDAVLVMFYDPCDPVSEFGKKHFKKASVTTERYNHAYAAVDCSKEPYLCQNNGATNLPFFRLYAKGFTVGSINDPYSFPHDMMRKFVEASPVFTRSVPPPFCFEK